MQGQDTIVGLRVAAPARLHLGFLDLNGGLGRTYGSIGLAVDAPATVIRVTRAETPDASGPERERVLEILARGVEAMDARGRYRVDVEQAIPAHAGLGSGTQLALAIGAALAELEGRPVSPQKLGNLTGRGARSAIGTAAFAEGGFIVDGGRGTIDAPPPVIVRADFPEPWRVILVLDPAAQGAHGDREAKAFAALAPFPDKDAAHLCRLVLMRVLPGIKETDIEAFGSALTEIQEIVGRHFAAAQGGSPWTSPRVGRLVGRLAEAGAVGIGQTSWGPTGFAFASSEAAAARLYHSLIGDATAEGLAMMIVGGRNAGARMEPVRGGGNEPSTGRK